ncbi:MAG: HEPN domain-containing protein [Candidatus Latescibacterota bacterium]|jgi:HEPN domain-containing protein
MPRDGLAEGHRWLEQADADRRGAQVLLEGGVYHLVCFLAQQVAEKAIKAFLYAAGEDLVVGHSVEALCRWAARYDTEFEQLRELAGPLDGYYIPTRYPNGLPDSIPARVYGRASADQVLVLCDHALDLVRRKLAALAAPT